MTVKDGIQIQRFRMIYPKCMNLSTVLPWFSFQSVPAFLKMHMLLAENADFRTKIHLPRNPRILDTQVYHLVRSEK